MTSSHLLALALALVWTGGYATCRARLGTHLINWADDQLSARPARSPRFWAAVPVALAATAFVWLVHPRRTRANYRAYQAQKHRRNT